LLAFAPPPADKTTPEEVDDVIYRYQICGWLLGLALLAGCAHYQPRPLAPVQSAAQFDSRRLDDAGLRAFATGITGGQTNWPPARWDLNALTLAALYFHPELAVARAQWRVAEAGVAAAGARPNPSVTFSPGYDTQIPNNPSPWLLPVSFDLPIEMAGKRSKRMAEAEQVAESARFGFVSAAWQIRSGVRASLLDYQLATRRVDLLGQQWAIQTNIASQLQGKWEAGAMARSELTPVEIALHKTGLDLGNAQAQQADARARLAQALGMTLPALEGMNFSSEPPTNIPGAFTVTEARGVALRQRADILAALADYAAAEADLSLQVAKQYPDLHLGPAYAWNNGSAGDNQWSLGATLELPVLDQNQGAIAQAEAQRKLAAAKFLALQAQVCAQIDRAVAALQAARDQWQNTDRLLAAERRQAESVAAQFAAGAADRLDVLNAQLEIASAALVGLDHQEKLQTALGTLEDALQQPADSLATVIAKMTAKM